MLLRWPVVPGITDVTAHLSLIVTNRICGIWNALLDIVVEALNVTAFKRISDRDDSVEYCTF